MSSAIASHAPPVPHGGHHFMMTPPGDELIAYALPDSK
jgi:hypothetical protein